MTFNIRNSYAVEDQHQHNWNYRRDKVVEIIKKYEPTIIGFQEVLHDQMIYLIDHLDKIYSYYGIGRDDGKQTGEYNPIFYKKHLNRIKEGTFWLSETPEIPSKTWPGCCYRICSWIIFRLKNVDLLVANTHFDEKFTETRIKSIEVLSILENKRTELYILMGDFNFETGSNEYEKIISQFSIKNSFQEANSPYNENLVTFHGFRGDRTSISQRFIDFIFYKGDLDIKNSILIYDNPIKHNLTYPSDHWPVQTTFQLKIK